MTNFSILFENFSQFLMPQNWKKTHLTLVMWRVMTKEGGYSKEQGPWARCTVRCHNLETFGFRNYFVELCWLLTTVWQKPFMNWNCIQTLTTRSSTECIIQQCLLGYISFQRHNLQKWYQSLTPDGQSK